MARHIVCFVWPTSKPRLLEKDTVFAYIAQWAEEMITKNFSIASRKVDLWWWLTTHFKGLLML